MDHSLKDPTKVLTNPNMKFNSVHTGDPKAMKISLGLESPTLPKLRSPTTPARGAPMIGIWEMLTSGTCRFCLFRTAVLAVFDD